MNTIHQLFFKFLQCELWQQPVNIPIKIEELNEVIRYSQIQGLAGLIITAILRNEYPFDKKEILAQYILIQKIKNRNLYVNDILGKFTKYLHHNNIEFCVVKGQVAAQCYPEPLLRMSGDIDYFCDSKNYPLAKKILSKSLQVDLDNHHTTKHDTFEFQNILFEQHSILTDFTANKHRRCWDEAVAQDLQHKYSVKVGDIDIPTLSPTLNAAYIFIHLFFHLMTTGIQIRQFCDWALWLHHYQKEIDVTRLERLLKGMGMYKAFCSLGAILTEFLGLPTAYFPFPITEKAKKKSYKYIQNILSMNEHGYGSKHITKAGFLHSIQTAFISTRQSLLYYPLARTEVGLRVPDMLIWFFKSRFTKGHRRKAEV